VTACFTSVSCFVQGLNGWKCLVGRSELQGGWSIAVALWPIGSAGVSTRSTVFHCLLQKVGHWSLHPSTIPVILKCAVRRPVLLKVRVFTNVILCSLVLGEMCDFRVKGKVTLETLEWLLLQMKTLDPVEMSFNYWPVKKDITLQKALIFIFKFVAAATDQSLHVMWCEVMWCGVKWCDVMWCEVK